MLDLLLGAYPGKLLESAVVVLVLRMLCLIRAIV